MNRGRSRYGMEDIVVVFAAVCLAIIVIGLVFPASRQFAMAFSVFVFGSLVAVGIGILAYVGWIVVRYAHSQRQGAAPSAERDITEGTEA